MSGLNQVRDVIVKTLTDAGLTAVASYGSAAKQYPGPVIAVDVAEAAGKQMAFGNYLGETYDAENGTVRELYGRRLDVSVSLEARAPAAADCEASIEAASDALLSGGLPSGLRLSEQNWEAVSWDRATRMFLRRGCLKCRAYFTAESSGESGVLLDFTLKGVLST
jgi:hypothetical protein